MLIVLQSRRSAASGQGLPGEERSKSCPLGPVNFRERLPRLPKCSERKKFCDYRRSLSCGVEPLSVDTNPATYPEAPKVPNRPTLPFTREERMTILVALDKYANRAGTACAQRLRAFVLLLRYSAMRIGDALQCGPNRLKGNKLFRYRQKTGVPGQCILPDFVVREIEAAPKNSERFFFWSGESKLQTAVGVWQQGVPALFTLAGVSGGHAHRFRDTFAVELLLTGVPLDRVPVLFGQQSIRVTERHDAPWTRSRQEQLEADLQRAWGEDPIALMQTKGTAEVHGRREQIN